MLETIRAYAFEKLRESGEADRVLRRQAAFFRALLTPAGAVSSLEPTPEAMVRYAREIGPDLLVMGAHGHGGIKDLIFGTTINPVRHALNIPILVVRDQ